MTVKVNTRILQYVVKGDFIYMKLVKKILKALLVVLLAISVTLSGLAIYVFFGNSQLPNIDPQEIIDSERDKVNFVFLGDSLTAGVYSDGSLVYSVDQQGHAAMIEALYKENNKLASSINFAVPGYQTHHLLEDLTQNRTFNDILKNSIMNEKSYLNGLKKSEPTAELLSQDISINDAIKDADVIVLNIGANDILNAVSGAEGGIDIDYASFKEYLVQVTNNVAAIEAHIRELNPDADVYYYGIYFAMPHYSNILNFALQPLLAQIDSAIFKGANLVPNDRTNTISIKEHFNSHLKDYVDNPNNIHPNELGYHAMMKFFFQARAESLNK